MSVQPTASGLASPSARSLPLPCSLALLLFLVVLSPFLLPGPPERPDRSRQARPFGQWPRQFVFRHAPRRLTCNNREQVCR
ncbi:hypothetical protein V8C43DRAFT_272177, partial [Trichoderma afarasin]